MDASKTTAGDQQSSVPPGFFLSSQPIESNQIKESWGHWSLAQDKALYSDRLVAILGDHRASVKLE